MYTLNNPRITPKLFRKLVAEHLPYCSVIESRRVSEGKSVKFIHVVLSSDNVKVVMNYQYGVIEVHVNQSISGLRYVPLTLKEIKTMSKIMNDISLVLNKLSNL